MQRKSSIRLNIFKDACMIQSLGSDVLGIRGIADTGGTVDLT